MEKQIKRFQVAFDFWGWSNGITIAQLREDLDELEKLGVTEIDISAEEEYSIASLKIEAFIRRIETDEELQKRINEEAQKQEEIKRIELKQLEKLKLKYGM